MTASQPRDLGVAVHPPEYPWDNDPHDPFYGTLPVRGQRLLGKVVRTRAQRSAVVEIERTVLSTKYHRYGRRHTRLNVHSPASVGAQEGDLVTIMECRPLSKTKSFVIIERRAP